ncbi:MAG: hypothetical protein H0V78_14805 [Burkholderiales bacterium]|nr:hypothetical protein [Burkholderiales bacterium]
MLKAIIAFGRHEVPQRHLADALWPDEEGDAAQEALNSAVHRLRKLLGDNDLIVVREGCISLNESRCWVDAWAFERLMTQAETARGANGANRDEPAAAFDAALDNSLALYRGAFLAADLEEPWALSTRERLRAKFIRHISARSKALMQKERWEQALGCYQRGLEADDLAEEFYQGIMRCYRQLERRAEGIAAYRRLRQTLSVTLGIAPSPASDTLYESLRAT